MPGESVLHTQGWLLPREDEIITTALDMMKTGTFSPNEIFEAMKALDRNSTLFTEPYNRTFHEVDIRQYAMADLASTAAYAGSELRSVWDYFRYGDSEVANIGKIGLDNGRYNYHAIGNAVKNGTVKSLESGFEEYDENDDKYTFGTCDIAGKLMAAMYKVVVGGFGDVRCLGDIGTSAAGAYIHVDNPDGTSFLHIDESYSGEDKEPVEILKDKFLEWRKDNPCTNENIVGTLQVEQTSQPPANSGSAPAATSPPVAIDTAPPTITPTMANHNLPSSTSSGGSSSRTYVMSLTIFIIVSMLGGRIFC